MMDFDFELVDGIAYFNEESRMVVEVRGGVYFVFCDGVEVVGGVDSMDAELWATCDVIVGPSGVLFNSGELPYSGRLRVDFLEAPLVLFKATNFVGDVGVPGFMAFDFDGIREYLPGGGRGRHYGGVRAVKAVISRVERLGVAEIVDSANFGSILVLVGTPCVFHLGCDGVVVLQSVEYVDVGASL